MSDKKRPPIRVLIADDEAEVRDAYRQIAADEPKRCVLVNANADANTVAASVWAVLRDRFFAVSVANAVNPA